MCAHEPGEIFQSQKQIIRNRRVNKIFFHYLRYKILEKIPNPILHISSILFVYSIIL